MADTQPKGIKERIDFNKDFALDWHDADEATDGYQLKWIGKNYARLQAGSAPATLVFPDEEHNKKAENAQSGNLFFTGDNIEVLKHLQAAYNKKVDMIYIDPPYNTGKEFVYSDKFDFSDEQLENMLGMTRDEIKRLHTINGRASHSAWLTFMYPRLRLAKTLLKDTGVIFISIDDNEQANLKLLCDEVFGEGNFVDVLHWKKKKQPSFLSNYTAKIMEYVLVYGKNKELLTKLSIGTISDATKKVINLSNAISARHFQKGVRVKLGENGVISKGVYTIKTMTVEYKQDVYYENGRTTTEVDVISKFSVSQEKIDQYIKDDLLFITVNNGLRRDVSLEETNESKAITDLLLDYGDNQDSEDEIKNIFNGARCFDYAKPVKLVYNFIKSIQNSSALVLDFFAGSGTTAHAVMQLNAEDGGNRHFILCQLDEDTAKGSEAEKAGYSTIDEICMERIKRAGAAFKHYTVKPLSDGTFDSLEAFDPTKNEMFSSGILNQMGGEDAVLSTYLMSDGVELTSEIKTIDIAGYKARLAGNRLYIIKEGWDTEQTASLLNMVGKSELDINSIVVFGYSMTFNGMKELELGVKQSLCDKKNLVIEKRW